MNTTEGNGLRKIPREKTKDRQIKWLSVGVLIRQRVGSVIGSVIRSAAAKTIANHVPQASKFP